MSYPDYRDLTPARSLAGVAAYFPMLPGALSQPGAEARRYWGTIASANYFDVLGVRPQLGRLFGPEVDRGAAPQAILSDAFWASRFHRPLSESWTVCPSSSAPCPGRRAT